MFPPVQFSLKKRESELHALLRTEQFGLQDMNVVLSASQAVISLIDRNNGSVSFRERIHAPESRTFSGFDVGRSSEGLMVNFYIQQAN